MRCAFIAKVLRKKLIREGYRSGSQCESGERKVQSQKQIQITKIVQNYYVEINSLMSIISLNISGLDSPIKRLRKGLGG